MAEDPPARPPPRDAPAPTIAAIYLGYYGALGVYGPFLALYLERRGMRPRDAVNLLALLPVVRVLSTPAWTLLADRLRSSGAVLRTVMAGALLSFAALEFRLGSTALIAALIAFTVFRSPSSSLLDALTLGWARRTGGDFGRLRAWGTVGYTGCTFLAGVLVARGGPQAIVHVTVALLAATALASLALPSGTAPAKTDLFAALGVLARRPRFVRLAVTAQLHLVGLAAYDTLFSAYVTGLSSAAYAGAAVAFGASAEVAFMARAKGWMQRTGLERTLAVAYGASALRWAVLATARGPAVLVGAQVLHAFTFGAFYLAAVAIVDEECPPEVRASGQGLFSALTWGVASAVGLAIAGWLRERGGLQLSFAVAAGAAALAAAVMLVAPRTGSVRP